MFIGKSIIVTYRGYVSIGGVYNSVYNSGFMYVDMYPTAKLCTLGVRTLHSVFHNKRLFHSNTTTDKALEMHTASQAQDSTIVRTLCV